MRSRSFTDSQISEFLSGCEYPLYVEVEEIYSLSFNWTEYRLGNKSNEPMHSTCCYEGNCRHVYRFDNEEQARDRLVQFHDYKEE